MPLEPVRRPTKSQRALLDAAQRLEALGAEPDPRVPPEAADGHDSLLRAARRTAPRRRRARGRRQVRTGFARPVDTGPVLALLERARAQLDGEIALGLSLQGSYSQSKPKEAAYGGHATAMGPAPADASSADDDASPSPVTFEEAGRLPTRTYCGGATKDHILESACGGVALLDYDGDGRLDIYLVTAAGLTPTRERIPHRNALVSQPRRMEVRGRVEEGGSGCRGVGQRRVRR